MLSMFFTTECQALLHYILSHSDQSLVKAVQSSSGLFKQPECSLSEFKSEWLHDYFLKKNLKKKNLFMVDFLPSLRP